MHLKHFNQMKQEMDWTLITLNTQILFLDALTIITYSNNLQVELCHYKLNILHAGDCIPQTQTQLVWSIVTLIMRM